MQESAAALSSSAFAESSPTEMPVPTEMPSPTPVGEDDYMTESQPLPPPTLSAYHTSSVEQTVSVEVPVPV
eukprot:CAMPEP_0115146946 /NCGR_PEP_ID=MMETSP0227-20121206/63011_1 /TAXON_ID=89957 /ORGANISM="Polarella glacialis, Strain CCMP 1383" /LENGTH=70 /DNA_ID=CAMNT_0002556747 /DNA_START=3 /DNA_END=211 /DNA_ORIENTATION=-